MRTVIEGNFITNGKKFAVLATRWNTFIVQNLIEGAFDALQRHGVPESDISLIYCPGAYEIPLTLKKLVSLGRFDAIIALGAVIRGSTPHFDYVASEVSKGIATVSLESGVPCSFGILTTDTIEQAVERAGTKAGNKGAEAAMVALEMVSLFDKLTDIRTS